MKKAEQLSQKMGQLKPVSFSPRPSVEVTPLPSKPLTTDTEPTTRQDARTHKEKTEAKSELVAIFAKIPKEEKRWVDHYKVDSGKELGEILTEAIRSLKKNVK